MVEDFDLDEEVLEDLRRLAIRVAGEAAAYVRDRYGISEFTEVVGFHSGDEGMKIDYESEGVILDLLRKEGFRGLFVGEERGLIKIGSDPFVAVVDPLDGSRNYASLVPWSNVSVAFGYVRDGKATLFDIVAGAVAPVFSWPISSFARGLGAYEGGKRLYAREAGSTRLVMAYVENIDQAKVVHKYLELVAGKRSVRALGSAALEAVWAGFGRAEVFLDIRGRLRVVDIAAGIGIALEAGAWVLVEKSNASLLSVEKVGSVIVASSKQVADTVSRALSESGFSSLSSKWVVKWRRVSEN